LIFLRKIWAKLAKKRQKQPLISHFDDNFPYFTPSAIEAYLENDESFQGVSPNSDYDIGNSQQYWDDDTPDYAPGPSIVPPVAAIPNTGSGRNVQHPLSNLTRAWFLDGARGVQVSNGSGGDGFFDDELDEGGGSVTIIYKND